MHEGINGSEFKYFKLFPPLIYSLEQKDWRSITVLLTKRHRIVRTAYFVTVQCALTCGSGPITGPATYRVPLPEVCLHYLIPFLLRPCKFESASSPPFSMRHQRLRRIRTRFNGSGLANSRSGMGSEVRRSQTPALPITPHDHFLLCPCIICRMSVHRAGNGTWCSREVSEAKRCYIVIKQPCREWIIVIVASVFRARWEAWCWAQAPSPAGIVLVLPLHK